MLFILYYIDQRSSQGRARSPSVQVFAAMSISETNLRTSYDGNNIADLTSVIAEFPEGDDEPNHLPIKKLQGAFDTISASEKAAVPKADNNMKVFVRIRPIAAKLESTVHVTSENSITTTAPTVSKRAKNTQIESRNYVS